MTEPNQELTKVISTINKDSCPNSINLHCHTTCSDGSLSPTQLIDQATKNGLQHISVTDHHSLDAYPSIINWLSVKRMNGISTPKLWTGIEISCLINRCLVHVLGFDFDISHPALSIYTKGESAVGASLSGEHVIKSIHEAGGIAILAHPGRYRVNFKDIIDKAVLLGIDGGEAWYDYDFNPIWSATPYICDKIYAHLDSKNLLTTCGTDTHGYSLLGR